MNDLVSVIIPTYNRYHYLLKAIESVKNQTYKNIEIIVVNDCSTDSNYENLNKIPDITVINLPVNMRVKHNVKAAQGETRNHGLRICKGQWIAFLDDDDYWFPKKIETQLHYLKFHNMKFCSTNMVYGVGPYNENNVYTPYFRHYLPQIFDKNLIAKTNFINNSSVVISREIVDLVGEFNLGDAEDWDYWKRALNHCSCLYLSQPLLFYDLNPEKVKHYIYS